MVEEYFSHRLAIIVVIYNMRREAPRTLYSLSADYQQDVSPEDYDVIVVENGSSEPMSCEEVEGFGPNFHYLPIENASPSPATAINTGVSQTKARFVGVMIDGARMASPGMINLALKTLESFDRPIIGTIAYHLGPEIQPRSIMRGYPREVEDELLAGIQWRNNGYGLFDISTVAPSSSGGRLGRIAARISPPLVERIRAVVGIAESSLIFMPKTLFDELQGFDERFDLPGGGLVNSDFYLRACELQNTNLITLSREATFHQIHGGAMTSIPKQHEKITESRIYREQFQKIRRVPCRNSQRMAMVIGLAGPDNINGRMESRDKVLQCHVDPASLKNRMLHFFYFSLLIRLHSWLRLAYRLIGQRKE